MKKKVVTTLLITIIYLFISLLIIPELVGKLVNLLNVTGNIYKIVDVCCTTFLTVLVYFLVDRNFLKYKNRVTFLLVAILNVIFYYILYLSMMYFTFKDLF